MNDREIIKIAEKADEEQGSIYLSYNATVYTHVKVHFESAREVRDFLKLSDTNKEESIKFRLTYDNIKSINDFEPEIKIY